MFDGTPGEALDKCKPMRDEIVLNTILLFSVNEAPSPSSRCLKPTPNADAILYINRAIEILKTTLIADGGDAKNLLTQATIFTLQLAASRLTQ